MVCHFFGFTSATYHYDRTIGRLEPFGSGFWTAVDLALGPDGRIYVVNRGSDFNPTSKRVTVLTFDEEYVCQFSQSGEEDGDLVWPTCIDLDSRQNVYVTDEWLNRVSVFDKDGAFLTRWGVTGSGDGELNKPSGIALDKEDNVYLVDSANNRVQKFTNEGKYLGKWGEAGNGEGQFNLPWGLTIDSVGSVYVADWRNDRVQKFTAEGEFLAAFGSTGNGVGEFNRPTDVAVDKDGELYITDWGNDRVQVLTPEGRHITTFVGEATMSKWGQDKMNANPDMVKMRNLVRDSSIEARLWGPKAVEIDEEGRIIIVDGYRYRLQVYQKDNYS